MGKNGKPPDSCDERADSAVGHTDMWSDASFPAAKDSGVFSRDRPLQIAQLAELLKVVQPNAERTIAKCGRWERPLRLA